MNRSLRTLIFAAAGLALFGLVACDRHDHGESAPMEGAHVHGEARLNIAVDDPRRATFELRAPGMSLYGFEHAAESAADKAAQEAALAKLKSETARLFKIDAAYGCKITATSVAIESGEHEHGDHAGEHADEHGHDAHESGEHSEVEAVYALECQREISGAKLAFGFSSVFPELRKLHVVTLSAGGQDALLVEGDRGETTL